MSGFKLLAIRPLTGCSDNFLKILTPEKIYTFYSDYTFKNEKGFDVISNEDVEKIVYNETIPCDLYNESEGLKINISAIVGKNGSGKSSLIEFLLYMVYYIGTEIGSVDPYYKKLENDKKKASEKSKEYYNSKEFENLLEIERKEHSEIINKLKGSIFYEIDEVFYELKVGFGDKKIKICIRNGKEDKNEKIREPHRSITLNEICFDSFNVELLHNFFYSIVINYSHYSLNSKQIGNWINCLFHKNDAYLTPLVVNPMREEGNFDINDEIEFANYRLLFNLIVRKKKEMDNNFIRLTDTQFVNKIRFTLNINKIRGGVIDKKEGVLSGNQKAVNLILDIQSVFFNNSEQIQFFLDDQYYESEIYNYLNYKIDKVSHTYERYKDGYDFSKGSSNLENINFLRKLKDDGSHVVFKIKQAINFLSNNQKQNIWIDPEGLGIFEFSLEEIANWINPTDVMDIMNHLPPSIFKIDILLGDELDDNKIIKFSQMSSGEQQIIHSVQSVIYHLVNLNSVHFATGSPITYKAINIVFDEIELYYHPDYQRKFINELLKSFAILDFGRDSSGIKYLNIIFSTHSPFILSDIPKQNILMLEYKSDKRKTEQISNKNQTFGANIHELLADSFFLNNGFIGDFAKHKIQDLISYLNFKEMVEISKSNPKPRELWTEEKAYSLINIVGEPIIKERLQFLFDKKTSKSNEIEILNRIERLNYELEKIRRDNETHTNNK